MQVQSSWFPLVDRNPQTFVDIYTAKESDFQKATQKVYRTTGMASKIGVMVDWGGEVGPNRVYFSEGKKECRANLGQRE